MRCHLRNFEKFHGANNPLFAQISAATKNAVVQIN